MKKLKIKNQRGFTLVETMIYIALFAFIILGALVSIYGILGASTRNQTKAMVQEEGSFLLGKMDWVLSGTKNASVSTDGLTLTAVRYDGTTMTIKVSMPDGNTTIDRGSGEKELNNSNVSIVPVCSDGEDNDGDTLADFPDDPDCATANDNDETNVTSGLFTYTAGSGDGINPKSVAVKFSVKSRTSEGLPYSQEFSTIKYIRQ